MSIERALAYISSEDRDTWVEIGMSLKAELGDGGFDLFDGWSQSYSKYKAADVKTVWRSFKQSGGIGIGTLYKRARDNGYSEHSSSDYRPDPEVARRREAEHRVEEQTARQAAAAAAKLAAKMVSESRTHWHPYLVSKKLSKARQLIWSGELTFKGARGPYTKTFTDHLLIPAWNLSTGALSSAQLISETGEKLFLPGGTMAGCGHVIGPKSGRTILCEGFATGLSVRAALDMIRQNSVRVVVCFSAHNLIKSAEMFGGFVVADHDQSETGLKAAVKTGLPYWMSPVEGEDANDYMRRTTVATLSREMHKLLFG